MSIPFDGTGWVAGMTGLPSGGTSESRGATAGTPGTWTPKGTDAPVSLAETISDAVVASPLTAWTAGQHVVTGSGPVRWNGTAWVAGTTFAEDELTGWTKAELTDFAEHHDPPIEVPASATKAQIIALILAALADDDAPESDEEN